jgi:uncharacterized damage-inducible protein DinB
VIDTPLIRELYRYNRWANNRLLEAVAILTVEEFTRNLGSSYPSVRDTLVHIAWAEWVWLQRWNGISPRSAFQPVGFPDLNAVKARWSEVEAGQVAFLETVTPERLLAVASYVNLKGETWAYPLWRQMFHVVNHSTYHRGQVTTMLRQLGARSVATDFLVLDDEAAG